MKYKLNSAFKVILILLIILQSFFVVAQRKELQTIEKYAKDLFNIYNFVEAQKQYQLLYSMDSLNPTYNYMLGACYLNTNIDKKKALPYLQFAVKNPNVEIEAWYELGLAYQHNHLFEEAIEAFKTYMKLQKTPEDIFFIPASRQIAICRNAMELIKNPIDVTFYNLGEQINTPFPEYNPYVPADESFIVFNARRDNNIGRLLDFDGHYTSDVYISTKRDHVWTRSKNIGSVINTDLVEEVTGMSSDGNILFIYIDNYAGFNDINWAHRRGRNFQRATYIGANINSNKLETAATISPDKETIIFASERDDTYGGTDLYISRKLPTGEWSPASNLGPTINTPFNEDYPMFSHDGKTLYFSSQGHNSMGGYDIFKSDLDPTTGKWSKPENLGYPLNTTDNNFTISFSESGRHAYVAALRPEGYGDLDIYKVVFNDVSPPLTIISGHLLKPDSSHIFRDNILSNNLEFKDTLNFKNENTVIEINVIDNDNEEIYGRYVPNPISGRYVLILAPGDYTLNIQGENYNSYSEKITIPNTINTNNRIKKDIVLTPTERAEDKTILE